MSFIQDFAIKKACLMLTMEYTSRTNHLTTEQRIDLYEQCFKMAADLGETEVKICLCDILGNLNFKCSYYRKAIRHFEIVGANVSDEGPEKIAVLQNIGHCYFLLGQFDQAIAQYEMSLNIAKLADDKKNKVGAYGNLGCCYYSLGQYDKAAKHHEMSLTIAKEIGDKKGEGRAYGNLGNCLNSLGQYEKSLIYHNHHLAFAKEFGDKQGERNAYGNIGTSLRSLGKYDQALHFLEKDLSIAKETGNIVGQAGTYCNLGNCYTCLGHYDKAIKYHQMGLKLAEKVGHKANEAGAHANLGNCYYSLRNYNIAVYHHKMHLRITKDIGNKAGERISYGNLGVCYEKLGQYENAIQHHELLLNIAKEIEDKAGEGRAYGNLGVCYCSLKQFEKAADHFEMALTISRQTKDKSSEGIMYCNLAHMFLIAQDYDRAVHYAERSIKCYEDLFENVPKEDQLKISICDKFSDAYITLTRSLLLRHSTEEALIAVERGRCRALAELMITSYHAECNEETAAKHLDVQEILEIVNKLGNAVLYFSIDSRLNQINTWIILPNGSIQFHQTNTTKFSDPTEINNCSILTGTTLFFENELNLLIKRARTAQRLVCSDSCEDRSLSSLLCNTNEKTELNGYYFNYSLNDCRSLVSLDQEKIKESILFEHRNIEPLDELRAELQDNPRKTLYKLLLASIRNHFEESSQVIIVAEGILNLVPFAALIDDDGCYLSEWLKIRLVPSLATAKMILESHQETEMQLTPLIVGDPDASRLGKPRLPCANEEAVIIGQLLGVEPLTGKDATKERFLSNISHANLIHIAAHGDKERGEILLAVQPCGEIKKENYMVMVSDFQNIRVTAKLVVLSCCNSARGKIRAEGVIGIARAFLGAGARSVLVALWAINDAATLYFMKEFYEHLRKGDKVNESLNKTMKTMRDSEVFCDPWHWAPFVLIGDDVSLF